MLLILCPKSKSGKGRKRWKRWLSFLSVHEVSYNLAETKYAGHAVDLASDSSEEVIVAVGGDGTINEVINGIKLATSPAKLAVLYAGTSPDFCRFHGLSLKEEDMVKSLLSCNSKKIDLVKIDYTAKSGLQTQHYFSCSANIGMGSDVADFSNQFRRYFGDVLGTFLGVIKAFFVSKSFSAQINIDGDDYSFAHCNHIVLMKNPYIASGIKINLPLAPNDGKSFILVIKDKTRLNLFRTLPYLYRGNQASLETAGFWIKPFKEVSISSSTPVTVEFDGDSKGYLPIKASVCPNAIDLVQ